MRIALLLRSSLLLLATSGAAQVGTNNPAKPIMWIPSTEFRVGHGFKCYVTDTEDVGGGHLVERKADPAVKDWLPEEVDPDGVWSSPVDGLRISLRFRTNLFRAGRPLLAYIFIRNAGSEARLQPIFLHNGSAAGAADLDVLGPQGTNPPIIAPLYLPSPKIAEWALQPGEERRFLVRLDSIYDLRAPGRYKIRARTLAILPGGGARSPLLSDWVEFTILKAAGDGP
jgi:hypothetical protein